MADKSKRSPVDQVSQREVVPKKERPVQATTVEISLPPEEGPLSRIAEAAQGLNAAADAANRKVAELERKLAQFGVGVEIWNGYLVEEVALLGSRGGSRGRDVNEPGWHQVRLGYAKVEDRWSIAVHEMWWSKDPTIEDGEDVGYDVLYSVLEEESYTPLLKTSRQLRLLAIPKIPELLEEIHRTLVECTNNMITATERLS